MLLDDGAIAQQFTLLHRAAEALKQATIQQPRSPVLASPYPHLEANTPTASHASFLPRSAVSETAAAAARGWTASAASSSKTFPYTHSCAATPLDQLNLACVGGPVHLARTVGDNDVQRLREIGSLLEDVAVLLQQTVEARLVDFYTHLAKKADHGGMAGLRATHASTPSPAHVPTPPRRPAETRPQPLSILYDNATMSLAAPTATASSPPHGGKASLAGVSTLEVSVAGEAAPPHQPRPRAAFILGPEDNMPSPLASVVLSIAGDNDSSMMDQSHPEDTVAGISRWSSFHQAKGLISRASSTYGGPHNAPMARKLEEERAAAAELQSFFYLLLEAALRQTDATAAAIYLDDAPLHSSSASAMGGGGGGADAAATRTASFAGTGRAATRPSSAVNMGGETGGTAAAAPTPRAQFLHCVAHVHGHFPRTISCALTNVLTVVAQTGIAVNLNYSDASAVLRPGGLGVSPADAGRGGGNGNTARATTTAKAAVASAAAAAAAAPASSSLYLDMYNGVVVPVKGVGCLVLANKAKRTSTVGGQLPPRFRVCDEHVAWSSALISEAVLRLYDRELLIRATGWAPPCAAVLRPFLHAKESPPAVTSMNGTLGRVRSNAGADGRRGGGGSRRRLPVSKTVTILPDPTLLMDGAQQDEAASLVFGAQNDIFSRRLTIVRTEDRQIGKALPPELRTSSTPAAMSAPASQKVVSAVARSCGSGASTFLSTSGQLNDEELFLAAAQYINNLESLWRKTISDSNTMHTMVDNYNKEIQLRGEKIVHLESRVRELNAHVVQLERRTNPNRFLAPTTLS